MLCRSVLLQRSGLQADRLLHGLQQQLTTSLRGIVSDIVRQKMVDMVVANLHGVVMAGTDMSSNKALEQQHSLLRRSCPPQPPPFGSPGRVPQLGQLSLPPYNLSCRELPILQLLELVMGDGENSVRCLDLGRNKLWCATATPTTTATTSAGGDCSTSSGGGDRLAELSRTIWRVVGERCRCLETLVIPKELSYNSTLKEAVSANRSLTSLTLKRNVPSNMFLSLVGLSCPNLKELDIAGAEVVTDFGVVCLLFADPEQIFMESWNREKTVANNKDYYF